jgi:hypothetical protein
MTRSWRAAASWSLGHVGHVHDSACKPAACGSKGLGGWRHPERAALADIPLPGGAPRAAASGRAQQNDGERRYSSSQAPRSTREEPRRGVTRGVRVGRVELQADARHQLLQPQAGVRPEGTLAMSRNGNERHMRRHVRRLEDQIAFIGDHRARAQKRRDLALVRASEAHREIAECDQLLAELRSARSELPGGRTHDRRQRFSVVPA